MTAGAYPAVSANTIVLWGRWFAHRSRQGRQSTIQAIPLRAAGQLGSGYPNLVDDIDEAEIKTEPWETTPLIDGALWALPLLPTADQQLGAFGGYELRRGDEPALIVELLESTGTISATQEMLDALTQACVQSEATQLDFQVGDPIQAVWIGHVANLSTPAPQPPDGFLTTAQTTSLIARYTWRPRGTWSSTTAYEQRDVVKYLGAMWVADAPSTGVTPGTGSTWRSVVDKGDPGATGTPGSPGAPGNPGPANSLAIGTVTTGAAGSSAAAQITGTAPSQTLNLTVPRGDKGDGSVSSVDGNPGPNVTLASDGAAGTATKRSLGTGATQAAAGNDSRITGAAQKAQNLADLPDKAVSRTNLGLGSAAAYAVADLPVSTATQTALNGKASTSDVTTASTADRARPNHTGQQTSATISDFTEAVQDAVAALLGAGSNITLNYDDAANTLTVSASGGGGGGLDAEAVRDAIGVALVGVAPVSVVVNDAADTITISTTATQNSTDAQLRDRSTHTGGQDASTVTTGVFDDARIPATIARDSEVADAVATRVGKGALLIHAADYGATGDLRQVTVSATGGSATITGSGFTSADTGKTIAVPGAGTSGAWLVTPVTYVNATTLTAATSAATAVSGVAADLGTDNAAAIAAARDAAVAGGKLCHLPAGRYLVASAITITSSGTHFTGDGPATVVKGVFAAATSYIFWNPNFASAAISGVSFTRMRIERGGANARHAIMLRNVSDIVIDQVGVLGYATDNQHSGAICIGGFVTGAATNLCTNVRVTRCYFKSSDNFAVQFGTVIGGLIANNVAEDAYREVFAVEPSSGLTSSDIVISDNVVVQGPSKATASTDTGCILATGTSGGALYNVTISGNTVRGGTVMSGDASPGIRVCGASVVSVTGNTVHGSSGSGIWLGALGYTTTLVEVAGNTVVGGNKGGLTAPGGSGIELRNVSKSQVAANIVSGAAHNYGIEENNDCFANHIHGNTLIDNIAPYGPPGTGSTYTANKTNTVGGGENNYSATGDPTVNSDASAGYGIGSAWVNTTTKTLFRCLGASVGAAVWQRQSADVKVFTADGTWNKPAWCATVKVVAYGPAGSGAAGGRGAAGGVRLGGPGGGSGGFSERVMVADDVTATVAVTVGTGGPGPAGRTTDGAPVVGNNGSGSTAFGNYVRALAGTGGTTTGSGGSGGSGQFTGSAGGVSSGTGGAGSSPSGGANAGGGGGGGGIGSASETSTGGAQGGTSASGYDGRGSAGTAGGGNGGHATAMTISSNPLAYPTVPGSGGGGGGSNPTGNGGNGGNGSFPGGGGGGGGATTSGTSGAGGSGAGGALVVISE